MLRKSAIPGMALVLGGLSCFDPASPRTDLHSLPLFRTDSTQYTVRRVQDGREMSFSVVFTNNTSRTVYFVNCLDDVTPALQKQVGENWTTIWAPVKLTCLSPPITVAPGASYDLQLRVFGADQDTNIVPKFSSLDLNGSFRLAWSGVVFDYTAYGPSFGEPLPVEGRVSNSFTLVSSPSVD
jgi:hypothetical protein